MTENQDAFAGILAELGESPMTTEDIMAKLGTPEPTDKLVTVVNDAELMGAVHDVERSTTPAIAFEWAGHAIGAAQVQAADERAKREEAERQTHRTMLIGVAVAGVLAAVVCYLLGKRTVTHALSDGTTGTGAPKPSEYSWQEAGAE